MAKKQHVSVRLAEADHRKMKDIAKRLGVKESDLFRFIIKNSLNKLLPFQGDHIRGADLIPVLLDCGQDLARYFDLDSEQLDLIVNGELEEAGKRIDKADLDILAMASASDHCARVKLAAVTDALEMEQDLIAAFKSYLAAKYLNTFNMLNQLTKESLVKTHTTLKTNKIEENQYA